MKSLLCLALSLTTLALYLPALRYDFLGFDDQEYVTENPHVRAGLTSQGLIWAFGYHASNWHPLTWLSHMLDCQLYGLHPAGHHLTNMVLHTGCTVLLFLLLSRMTGSLWRSAFVATLFGWHPLHVESVAWVAERKDVLSAFFFMLTLTAYATYVSRVGNWEVQSPKPKVKSPKLWYCLTLLFFALGLMSKPMLVTLPFVLLLLDYWPLSRFQSAISYRWLSHLLLEKLPFFALAAIACVLTLKAQSQAHAVASVAGLPFATRIAHAVLAYAHYVATMFVPTHLAVFYPYERILSPWKIIAASAALGLISLTVVVLGRKRPYLLVGWLWFLGMLVPVIGLVQVGEQAWADRYTYLPLVGLFLAIVWAVSDMLQSVAIGAVGTPRPTTPAKVGRGIPTGPVVVAVALGLIPLTLSSLQLRYWKNTRTLFEHAAAVTDNNYMAVTLLGSLLAKEGKLEEAIEHYNTALKWKPDYPEAHFFRGNALDQQGKLDAAIAEYNQALRFKPMQAETHILLGVALAKQKQYDEAAKHYRAALELSPDSAVAHNNLARALHTQGKFEEAIEHYSAALRLDPDLAEAHNNLGILLLTKGKLSDGIKELRESRRLKPNNREAAYNLATALNQHGDWSEAADLLGKIVTDVPGDPNAHCQLGVALSHLGKTREAMSHYANALLIQQDFPDALDALAWLLATAPSPEIRNGTQAVTMAERACELTSQKDAAKLKTLAAAYAELGNFPKAMAVATNALEVAISSGRTNVSAECEGMLKNFTAAKPWRQ